MVLAEELQFLIIQGMQAPRDGSVWVILSSENSDRVLELLRMLASKPDVEADQGEQRLRNELEELCNRVNKPKNETFAAGNALAAILERAVSAGYGDERFDSAAATALAKWRSIFQG